MPSDNGKSSDFNEEQNRLRRNWSKTQQELQQLMRVRASTPMSAVELNQKDQEIEAMRQQLERTEMEMNTLRETIRKQEVTIKTQSQAISNPKQHYATPNSHRFGDNQQYGSMRGPALPLAPPPPPPPPFFHSGPQSGFAQPNPPPPQFAPSYQSQGQREPKGSPFSVTRNQQWNPAYMNQPQGPSMQPLPQPFRQASNVNEFGSPEPLKPFNVSMGHSSTPRGSSRGSHGTPNSSGKRRNQGMYGNGPQPSAQPPIADNSMALVPTLDMAIPEAVIQQFSKVLHMAEMYAWAHVNTPSTHKDNSLPQEIKDRLLKAASTTSAFQFMQTPFTRYFLVDKIIVQWVLKNVLKHDCFAGCDLEVDQTIDSCKNQIYHSTPAQVKFQLLSTIGEQMQKLKQNRNFENHVNNLARIRGNELWSILKPMMHQKTSRDWDDLYTLMLEAHSLAQLMYSGSEEYRFDYPVMGQPFRRDTMDPRDPFKNIHPPEQLEANGATVRLGITPHIVCRTSTSAGHVRSITMLKALVLIKADK